MSDIQIPLLCKHMSGGRLMYVARPIATWKLKIHRNEQGGLLARLVLHQVPMLSSPSIAAQVTQFLRRFKREHVPPIFTKTLSVVWQTHCPCKKTCSSLQEKSLCQTMSLAASFAARTFVGSWVADIFMSLEHVFIMAFWRCCIPSLEEAGTAEGLAVARSTYTAAFCYWLALFREEISLWQERTHFVGLYQLLLACISNA